MYFFSSLALTLNEPEEGIAPTDSRMRPDQRLMEAGLWDEANVQKQRLEECQRLERKRREAQATQALEEGETEENVTCLYSHHVFLYENRLTHHAVSLVITGAPLICVITTSTGRGRHTTRFVLFPTASIIGKSYLHIHIFSFVLPLLKSHF